MGSRTDGPAYMGVKLKTLAGCVVGLTWLWGVIAFVTQANTLLGWIVGAGLVLCGGVVWHGFLEAGRERNRKGES
jgi:hypothetical protein